MFPPGWASLSSERRANPTTNTDLLARLLDARDDEGVSMDDFTFGIPVVVPKKKTRKR